MIVTANRHRQRDRWTDYMYGERVYIMLSLVAKSALAWQVRREPSDQAREIKHREISPPL